MTPLEIALLIGAGVVAGALNTLAGGGSVLTVPLLVLLGLPGTIANGTNRVGILIQSLVAAWRFRAEGVSELRSAAPLLLPIGLGSLIGAAWVSQITDENFEKLFAAIMLLLFIPMLRGAGSSPPTARLRWSPLTSAAVFFAIGLYGGAIQAGVSLVLLFALTRAGFDWVRASAAKVVIAAALALVAVPVFVWQQRVSWWPAALLSIGFSLGAVAGARIAVRGGERVIRAVVVAAIVVLAGHLLGLY